MAVNFAIHLDHPSGHTYFPGAEVNGDVSVRVSEPRKFKSIQVSLVGNGYVGVDATDVEETTSLVADEKYVNLSEVLWKREDTPSGKLPAGEHVFRFGFTLPRRIPPSFCDKKGLIHYFLEARISTGRIRHDYVAKTPFQVAAIVDVNSCPRLQMPVCKEKKEVYHSFMCGSTPITVSVGLPRRGYCIGEIVPVSVMVENGSNRRLVVKAALIRTVTYDTTGFYFLCKSTLASSSIDVQKRSSTPWNPANLKIPLSEPGALLYSKIIKIVYSIEIETSVVFSLTHLSVAVPLTVGNVALQESFPSAGQWPYELPPSYEQALGEPAMYVDPVS